MKNIHWLRKGSKIKKIKDQYKLYRMGKKIRFIDRDDTAIIKWIKDWVNILGPHHERLITELNDNIIDFTNTLTEKCPDLALNIKMDYWDENKEYTN